LNAASLEDVKEWYRTYYGPNNAVISLAGDITPQKALQLVKKYFDGIKPGPPLPRTEKWIPALDRNIRDEMQDRVPQARIYRVYHAPAWKDLELQNLGLFADVLSGSKSARLSKRLVYEKELATNVSAFVNDGELASSIIFIATVKPGVNPADVEREMDVVINEALEKGITSEELNRAQNRNLAGFLRGTERLGGFGGRSDILAESMTYGGAPDFYLKRLEAMATATPEMVKATANKWLRANNYTMLVKPFENLTAGTTSIDRKILPTLSDAPDIKFPEVQRAKLKNGLNVILLERHSAPIVNVALAVDAGYASDSPNKAGLASLALGLLDEGTKTRDAFEIVNQLDSLGARLNTGSSLDLSFVRLQATSENLKPSLGIMSDVVLNPAFPNELFTIQKQNRIAQIGQEKATANALALRILPAILYGANHAYGTTNSGTEATIQTISRDDLIKWHSDWFKPGSSTIIVTGDTTLAKVTPMLEEAFGSWKAGTAPKKNISNVAKTAGKKIYLIDKPGAPQSTIVAAHISEASGQTEDLAGEPLFRNFGGMSTSRLNRNLRLDKHWSYGTSGALRDARGQRTFLVLAPVQTDKTKESMVEVKKEIADVAGARPVSGEEFQSIMRNMTLRLPGRFETLSSLEAAAIDLVNYNLPDDYWANYGSAMRGLTEAQLETAGRKFVRPDEIIWLIVGDVSKIESGVRSLGYGEVIKLNSDGEVIK
jgi:zinc protease